VKTFNPRAANKSRFTSPSNRRQAVASKASDTNSPHQKKSRLDRATRTNWQTTLIGSWRLPGAIVALTLLAFLPVLRNEFVNWDDQANFLDNRGYRGLGWSQLRWMFTTFHMGHYQPLSWLTLGVDYFFWGLNPFGYHLTNLMLHAATAVVVFFLARELFYCTAEKSAQNAAVSLGAGVAALLFAVHPLRVESVAWVTERRDVLSGLFYTLSLLAYVFSWRSEKFRGRWYWTALGLFLFAVLAKSITVTLPAILLILDIYPLKRIGGSSGWWSKASRAVYWEKIPFFVISGAASAVAFIAIAPVENLATLETLGVVDRLTVSVYSLWFYFWKTLAPFNLSPMYEMPKVAELSISSFLIGYVFVIGAAALGFALRRRLPAIAAAEVAYLITLLPVLGIFQNGPQITADRYSYLACVGWVVLAGAGAQRFWQASFETRVSTPTVTLGSYLVGAIILGLAFQTWRQALVWRDSETLWKQAATVGDTTAFPSAFAHHALGLLLAKRGDIDGAVEHFGRSVELRPESAKYRNQFGAALESKGRLAEATLQYQNAVKIQPQAAFYSNLGGALAKQGRFDEALWNFNQALALSPDDGQIHFNLANALVRQDHLSEAVEHFQKAVKLQPDFAEAYHSLGRVVAAQGQLDRAIEYFKAAIRIKPEFAEAHQSLAQALAEQGKRYEAMEHFQEALRILKSHPTTLGGLR
jgi:protein O-mannosyl-transferase